MKTAIHPAYHKITVSCACGNSFEVGSTHAENMRVEICSNCHPLYTGKSKLVDTAGRVDKFQARQQQAQKHRDEAASRLAKAEKPAKTEESK